MAVTVKFFANFREAAGVESALVEAADVYSLLKALVAKFGERLSKLLFEGEKLRETACIIVNGKSINLSEGLRTKLKDGDVVAIFPPVSGG
ncbi:MAG: ubiquitin-like small modifier protein 1 [Candidatus Hadarchaeum sp.]|uniref:ubiquitin-like small modifier protein 1 n=1 Tax=Candidatus Hadarchaeum sp. TaxID=2883567 RepID=UPI003D1238C5